MLTNKSIMKVFHSCFCISIIHKFCRPNEPATRRSVYVDFIMKMIFCGMQVFQQSPKSISAAVLVMLVCQN